MTVNVPKSAGFAGRRQRAIVALVSSPSMEEAARRAGCSPKTLRRWLSEPLFHRAVEAEARAAYCESLRRVQALAGAAVDALAGLLSGSKPELRLAAARSILETAGRAFGMLDVEKRLSDIEARLDGEDNGPVNRKTG